MIKQLKESSRWQMTLLLAIMTTFCFGLSLLRIFVTGTPRYLFLNWNLFLAAIPWLLSTLLAIKGEHHKFSLLMLIAFWLLFFPNSPYILTDLFHLKLNSSAPIWYDLIVILSYAWTGLLLGFISLMDIEELLKEYIKPIYINLVSVVFIFMSSFGIYLGRFLRWKLEDVAYFQHYYITNSEDEIIDWAVIFEKDNELRFSIIIHYDYQGEGMGKQLVNQLIDDHKEFYGWVIDHDNDLKLDGDNYRSPLPFYIKHGFEVLSDIRIDNEMLSAVKIKWNRN
ncbi:MAG: GNAT family N-acetyltransferase [Bacteroidetes bacterium]|nr:GNAT family N-acetyltransferase [Bacteroidota bacterium]